MASSLKNLASLKMKDVPTYLKSSFSREAVSKTAWSSLYRYNDKYIQTGSIRPLMDVMIGVGIVSYAVSWPKELRHLRHHEAEAAQHGKH